MTPVVSLHVLDATNIAYDVRKVNIDIYSNQAQTTFNYTIPGPPLYGSTATVRVHFSASSSHMTFYVIVDASWHHASWHYVYSRTLNPGKLCSGKLCSRDHCYWCNSR
jgi:hypothetical protein